MWSLLVGSLTGLVTFFVGMRRGRKEVESLHLDNLTKSIDIYNRIINDMEGQIETLLEKVDNLEKRVEELHKENVALREMLKNK